ncbi:uncharacterized protein K441DRAFT_676892 [Cenococcum geophilum 1.58]|uniref:uncharacterized protein n=1 Tax=Cenococcum geophilum 1.58 TaxID=794803 RepID=UPI00358E1B32|nr:hypothetical protein K441DRAFT_676892 [Cenococcum geophilum 1.58]
MYFSKISLFSRILFFLTTAVHIHFISANEGRRPLITPAALMPRQDASCPKATDTVCPDGLGCCQSGAACTWTRVTIPICAKTCNPPVVYCAGAYSGVCCDAGSSCDYASQGLCTATSFAFSAPSITIPSINTPHTSVPSIYIPSVSTPSIVVPSLSFSSKTYSYEPPLTTSTTVTSAEESSTSVLETTSGTEIPGLESLISSTPSRGTSVTTTTERTSTAAAVSTAGAGNGVEVWGNGLLELMVGGIVGLVLGV